MNQMTLNHLDEFVRIKQWIFLHKHVPCKLVYMIQTQFGHFRPCTLGPYILLVVQAITLLSQTTIFECQMIMTL